MYILRGWRRTGGWTSSTRWTRSGRTREKRTRRGAAGWTGAPRATRDVCFAPTKPLSIPVAAGAVLVVDLFLRFCTPPASSVYFLVGILSHTMYQSHGFSRSNPPQNQVDDFVGQLTFEDHLINTLCEIKSDQRFTPPWQKRCCRHAALYGQAKGGGGQRGGGCE